MAESAVAERALRGNAEEAGKDEYGDRYVLDFECQRHGRSVIVRGGWIVRRGDDVPRLTTCNVLSG